jgi:hypothetical protein
MFKGANRFSQSRAFRGRSLSGYPKTRKLEAGRNRTTETQFVVGTAYVRQLSPLIENLLQCGLEASAIAAELTRRNISTPSGDAWVADLASQLVSAVRLGRAKMKKRLQRKRGDRQIV